MRYKTLLATSFVLAAVASFGNGLWINGKALVAQQLLKRAWTQTLTGQDAVKPWPWADTWPVARLSVPRLGLNQWVLAGVHGQALAFGPGLVVQEGTTLIAGHEDTHFDFLQQLKTGDLIELEWANGNQQTYQVASFDTVEANNNTVTVNQPTQDNTLWLMTCVRATGSLLPTSQRLVVGLRAAS